MNDSSEALREMIEQVESAGDALRSKRPEAIAESIARAWDLIADPERSLGRSARQMLPQSTGLTLPMVAWALSTTFATANTETLLSCVSRMTPSRGVVVAPPRLGVLVLAGNVFTACVQPISIALLARVPTIVKASSRDDMLPRLFHAALAEADPSLADALAVVTLPRGDDAQNATLFARADVVSVYGSDATLRAIRGQLAASTTFVGHGHGIGVGFVARGADLDEAARAFARDVAAYDQRGCMSPHAIGVDGDARAFAHRLAEALGKEASHLPRGALPIEVGGAQIQWRGVGAVRGELLEGDGYAVSYEAGGALRISPGYRNVLVLDAESTEGFARAIAPLGAHLKAVGVAANESAALNAIAAALPAPLAPRVTFAGEMQRPPLDAYADGLPPWAGLVRYIAIG